MNFLRKVRDFLKADPQPSQVVDQQIVAQFSRDPDAPYLVSFPRTGSHWLRMLMELYFERPLLTRTFYYPHQTDYLLVHKHDQNLGLQRRNVLYLYREPVATIYSQLRYYNEAPDDAQRVHYWADLYGRHLAKWLLQEDFTTHKTVLRYERLQRELPAEFEKIAQHFGQALDAAHLLKIAAQITKEEVKRKTAHDEQVVNLQSAYPQSREAFREAQTAFIWQIVLATDERLRGYFDDDDAGDTG